MLNSLKEKASAGIAGATTAINERLDTAKGGKKMVDEGGEPVKAALSAKKLAMDAVAAEKDATRRLQQSADSLETAARALRDAAAMPAYPGITGKESFLTLAESYEAKAAEIRKLLPSLSTTLESPTNTPVEVDALSMITVQGGYQSAKSQTRDALAQVKRTSGYTGAAAGTTASPPTAPASGI